MRQIGDAMISKILQERMKIDIRVFSQVERAETSNEEVHVYKSQIYEIFDNGELEIIMPFEGGKMILLPLGLRYEFVFYTPAGLYKSIGQVKERYKTENRYMLRVVLNTPLSKFQRREYYRMECALDMSYFILDESTMELGDGEEIIASLRDEEFYEKQKKGIIVDLSGGGVRFVSKEKNEDGSYVLMLVVLNTDKGEKQFSLPGRIIRCIRLETAETRYENRVEFLIQDSRIREEIIRYIFVEERRTRKNGKG